MTQTRAPIPKAQAGPAERPPRLEPAASFRLTGLGAIVVLAAFCFAIMAFGAWTGWQTLAGAAFVCGCGVVTYYTRTSGLRALVVCPPLLFCAGSVCAQLIIAPTAFLAAEGIVVTLGTLAPWLFTGTALTIVIAFGRGYRPLNPLNPLKPLDSRRPGIRRLLDGLRDGFGPRLSPTPALVRPRTA